MALVLDSILCFGSRSHPSEAATHQSAGVLAKVCQPPSLQLVLWYLALAQHCLTLILTFGQRQMHQAAMPDEYSANTRRFRASSSWRPLPSAPLPFSQHFGPAPVSPGKPVWTKLTCLADREEELLRTVKKTSMTETYICEDQMTTGTRRAGYNLHNYELI